MVYVAFFQWATQFWVVHSDCKVRAPGGDACVLECTSLHMVEFSGRQWSMLYSLMTLHVSPTVSIRSLMNNYQGIKNQCINMKGNQAMITHLKRAVGKRCCAVAERAQHQPTLLVPDSPRRLLLVLFETCEKLINYLTKWFLSGGS